MGTIETGEFIDLFRKETAGDPANAALLVQASQPEKSKRPVEVTYIVELMDMQYDAVTATSTFTIKLLADPASLDMHFLKDPQQILTGPVSYGASQMFIDAGGLMQLIAYGAQD